MWRKQSSWAILLVLAAGIKLFSFFPDAVEKYYATGLYPVISGAQRLLFGWIPFSVGDIFYTVVGLVLVYRLFLLVKKVVQRKTNRQYWWDLARKTAFVVLAVYVSFNLLWGLNYNRRGVASQLGIEVNKYTKEELVGVMEELVHRLNTLDSVARVDRASLSNKGVLFRGAIHSYKKLNGQFPVFGYSYRSVKPSLFSILGNYMGYTGYYNPFSGEAQVNTTVPLFVQPFTTCHEIGHQLGYAKENEANFAGYLAARASDNPAFRYSVYFDLYAYSRFYLLAMDSTLAKKFDDQLRPQVKDDYRELREFVLKHRNPLEALIDKIYGQYLKANEQPEGKLSYSEVISWLVAYARKFGKDAI